MLTPFGWAAFAIGKWHLTPAEDMSLAANRKWWPLGRGFDRYYGFLGGDTDQYYPWLTYDNHFVKPPATPEEGYHNVPDLTEKAKEFIADVKQVRRTGRSSCITALPAMLRTMSPRIDRQGKARSMSA
jgi:arylsulfatase